MSSVLAVEEAVAGLEEEQTRLGVIVIRGYAECPKTFALSQQLLFSRIGPLVGSSLGGRSHGKHKQMNNIICNTGQTPIIKLIVTVYDLKKKQM